MIRISSSNKRLSFRDLNLSGQDFSRLKLDDADLTKACLHCTNFEGASLLRADFPGCDVPNALFDNVSMNWSRLHKGNFSGTSFIAASLPHVSAEECIFDSANCEGCYFGQADLSRGTFKEANLSKADFYKTKLLGCNLSRAKLANAKMENADLSGADLGSADLSGCVFSNVKAQIFLVVYFQMTTLNPNLARDKLQPKSKIHSSADTCGKLAAMKDVPLKFPLCNLLQFIDTLSNNAFGTSHPGKSARRRLAPSKFVQCRHAFVRSASSSFNLEKSWPERLRSLKDNLLFEDEMRIISITSFLFSCALHFSKISLIAACKSTNW
ncbi:hypothetical protein ACLB2K_053716 [Fragaria x ananassa]